MSLTENIERIKEVMGLNEKKGRIKLDFKELYDKGIVFVTKCHNLTNGEPCEGTQLITLYNIKHPSKEQKFITKALGHMAPEDIDWWQKNQEQLSQDKYEQILKSMVIFEKSLLYEDMRVDDFGRLHDEDVKVVYPYKRISKLVKWFDEEFGDYAAKQGWSIFSSDSDLPKIKYNNEPENKYNLFFQVQRIDDPMEGEAQFGRLKNDQEADELARKMGLMLDEHGVVIGWDGESYIE